jgi:transcriptional regulator with XRE-family HTH domain
MARPSRFQSETLQCFWDRYIGEHPERIAEYEQAAADVDIARAIYDVRAQAGLTQRQLAKKVGTTASVICRLEDADYEGHSLAMLRRIAEALGKRIEIRFLPATKRSPGGLRRRRAKAPAPLKLRYAVRMVSDLSPEIAACAAARRAIGTR